MERRWCHNGISRSENLDVSTDVSAINRNFDIRSLQVMTRMLVLYTRFIIWVRQPQIKTGHIGREGRINAPISHVFIGYNINEKIKIRSNADNAC